jgi:hypothetical protein
MLTLQRERSQGYDEVGSTLGLYAYTPSNLFPSRVVNTVCHKPGRN